MKCGYDSPEIKCKALNNGICEIDDAPCDYKPLSSDAVLGGVWRNVRKELPEKDVYVLCFCEERDILNGGSDYIISVGVYSDGYNDKWKIQKSLNFARYEIMAWMPLPDPPAFV